MSQAFMESIHSAVKAARRKTFEAGDQMTLGQMIDALEEIALTEPPSTCVHFDFEYLIPAGIDSWRGSYDELALSFSDGDGAEMHLDVFLGILHGAVGATFQGYKGGDFTMSRDTPVWVANPGNSGDTAVIGITNLGWKIRIDTGPREF